MAEPGRRTAAPVSGVTEPPVSEESSPRCPNPDRTRRPRRSGSAATQWSHGRWLILLNGAVSRGRQRWSLAHELKHILDHPF